MTRWNPKSILAQRYLKEAIPKPKIEILKTTQLHVLQFGLLADCILRPGDIIHLGEGLDGDVLLVEASHTTMKMLYPEVQFARQCGRHVLLDTPRQPTIDLEQWTILGAAKGLERSLTDACVGDGYWHIRVLGADGWVSREWINLVESQPLDAIYLSELTSELSVIPDVSILAARQASFVEEMQIPNPGTIVFSFRSPESTSMFATDWEAGSRRRMRLKRLARRMPKQTPALYPLPKLREKAISERADGFNRVIPFGDLASK
mgnify:CR=1 FL=1